MSKYLIPMNELVSTRFYDVRYTDSSSGKMITAKKRGIKGHRFFIAWDYNQLSVDAGYNPKTGKSLYDGNYHPYLIKKRMRR